MPRQIDLSSILLEEDDRKSTQLFQITFPNKEFRLVAGKDLANDQEERWIDFTMHRVMKDGDRATVEQSGLLLCGLGVGMDGYYKPSQIRFEAKRPELRLRIEVDSPMPSFSPIAVQELDYFSGALGDVQVFPCVYINQAIEVPGLDSLPAATRLRLQHHHLQSTKIVQHLLREGQKNPAWAMAMEAPIESNESFEKNLGEALQGFDQQIAEECNLLYADYALAISQSQAGLIDIAIGAKSGTAYRRLSLMRNASEAIARIHALLSGEVFAMPKSAAAIEEVAEEVCNSFQPSSSDQPDAEAGEKLPIDAPSNSRRRGKAGKKSAPAA